MRYAADVRKIWYCRLWEHSLLYVLPHLALALTLCILHLVWPGCFGASMCRCSSFIISPGRSTRSATCAQFGYRSFDTSDQSRNNFWIGVLGFGEGYHNNHHAQPRCAAHGLSWWEFDLTRYVIWVLEKCGLAWKVVWPAKEAKDVGRLMSAEDAARC